LILLIFTPIKDYLIALGFTYMYYSQGIKNVDKTLDAKAKEKLLFEEESEAKEVYSNNL
jgi:hypothetical protein